MADEVNFMDLASLLKITPNTPLEKLGSALNASIFDASNIAGTLKQKGLIEFTANYPGPNAIKITDAGQALIKEADLKSTDPLDSLDQSILEQLSGGKRVPFELQNTLNVSSKDLALRIYKLDKQGFTVEELKNGGVDIMLTEKGFLKSKPAASPKEEPAKRGFFGKPIFKPQAKESASPAPGPTPQSNPQSQQSQPQQGTTQSSPQNPYAQQSQPAMPQEAQQQPAPPPQQQSPIPGIQQSQPQQQAPQPPPQAPQPQAATAQQGPVQLKRPLGVTLRKNISLIIAAILVVLLIYVYFFVA